MKIIETGVFSVKATQEDHVLLRTKICGKIWKKSRLNFRNSKETEKNP